MLHTTSVRVHNNTCIETYEHDIPTFVWKQFALIAGKGKARYKYVKFVPRCNNQSSYQLQVYCKHSRKSEAGTKNRNMVHIANFRYERVAALYFSIIHHFDWNIARLSSEQILQLIENEIDRVSKDHSAVESAESMPRILNVLYSVQYPYHIVVDSGDTGLPLAFF